MLVVVKDNFEPKVPMLQSPFGLARLTGPGRVLVNGSDDLDLSDLFHAAAADTCKMLEVNEGWAWVSVEVRNR